MEKFNTKNWIIGILVSSWIASFVVGFLHGAELLSESANPLIHTTKDWLFVAVIVVPISYLLARIMPNKQS